MVRKQIYIRKPQDAILKRLALACGLTEAEIIRQEIEQEIAGADRQFCVPPWDGSPRRIW